MVEFIDEAVDQRLAKHLFDLIQLRESPTGRSGSSGHCYSTATVCLTGEMTCTVRNIKSPLPAASQELLRSMAETSREANSSRRSCRTGLPCKPGRGAK